MNLRSINLNLLPILQALLREKSVSRAAEQLGMSQSAASDALARLRETFDDAILVRVGSNMVLTPRATELIGPVETMCEGLEQFFVKPHFDPASAERRFVIATSDYGVFLATHAWREAFRRVAPGVQMRFVSDTPMLNEQLADRDVDLALIPKEYVDEKQSSQLHFVPVLNEMPLAIFRRGHPLQDKSTLEYADLAPYSLIAFHPGIERVERRRPNYFSADKPFKINAFVNHVTMLPYLVLETDSFAIVPERLGLQMATLIPIEARKLSFAQEPIHLGLMWSSILDSDPAHRWFRKLASSLLQTLPSA